jgi:hypothetical protein
MASDAVVERSGMAGRRHLGGSFQRLVCSYSVTWSYEKD